MPLEVQPAGGAGGGGSGDVVGTPPSTNNAIARYDGITGLLLQNSVGILSDDGALSGLISIAAGNTTSPTTNTLTITSGSAGNPGSTGVDVLSITSHFDTDGDVGIYLEQNSEGLGATADPHGLMFEFNPDGSDNAGAEYRAFSLACNSSFNGTAYGLIFPTANFDLDIVSDDVDLKIGAISGTDTARDIVIDGSNTTTDGDVLIATNYGKCGIGNATPSEMLDVTGNIAVSGTVDGIDIAGLDTAVLKKAIGTTKGDVIAFTASATPARLGVGTNDQVLTADSSEATGMKWADVGGGLSYWAEDGSGHLLPSANQTYNIGSATYSPAWVFASCTRIGADGGFSLRNVTDTQTFDIRYGGNNVVIFNGCTEGKFYYGMNFVGTVRPNTNGAYDLGTSTNAWRALYLDDDTTNGGAIFFNAGTSSFIKSDSAGTTLNIDGFTTLLDFSASGEVKIKYYSQSAEPTLANNQAMALWEDTDDNSVHLLVKNAAGTQTKLSFA